MESLLIRQLSFRLKLLEKAKPQTSTDVSKLNKQQQMEINLKQSKTKK